MDTIESIGKLAEWIVPTIVAVAAYVKYRVNSRDSHAKTMLELMREFQQIHADTFYSLVERKETEFYLGNLIFDNSENERKADALLLFLENILHLHVNGTISNSEFVHFEYYLKRVIGDPVFARYLHDFGVTCSEDGTVNPFSRVLDYFRSQSAFKSMRTENVKEINTSVEGLVGKDAKAASEAAFMAYLTQCYHGVTRTAKSVKSRVDGYLSKKGWSYEQPPTKGELLTAIKTVCADVNNPDTAASIRAALRQYYRASFGEEPKA